MICTAMIDSIERQTQLMIKNTNFTEQAQNLCGLTCFLIEKRASKTCKTLLMTMWLPWQQSICERYASLRSAVGLMLCYLMCGTFTRCNDRNSATCMLGCLFRCLQAVCIISQWCWSWYFFFCYVVGESSCVQNPVYPKPRAALFSQS